MGGYRLPIGGQRRVHKKERLRQPRSSQKAKGARHARRDPARQQRKIENPLKGRACVRGAKGPDGFVHSHHRHCASDRENRPRQSRLQHSTPALLAARRDGPTIPSLGAVNAEPTVRVRRDLARRAAAEISPTRR